MFRIFRKLFVIYSIFSTLPLFANEEYPDWMRQLGENYPFQRVAIARAVVEIALPDDHKLSTHGAAYGVHGAYQGRALAHRRATKKPLAESDLLVLAQFWAEQRQRGPYGDSSLPFVEIMETYRLTGPLDDPLDRNPDDLCKAFNICPSRIQLDTYLLLLNCFIQLKDINKPPTQILLVLSNLEKLPVPTLVKVSEDPGLLETWFEPNKSRFVVLEEDFDEAIDDSEDEEVAQIEEAAGGGGGGGGRRRTPSFDELAAILSQAQAEATTVPAFLPELGGKKKGAD